MERELFPNEALPPQMDSLFYWSQKQAEYRFEEMSGLELRRHLHDFEYANELEKVSTIVFHFTLAEFPIFLKAVVK